MLATSELYVGWPAPANSGAAGWPGDGL